MSGQTPVYDRELPRCLQRLPQRCVFTTSLPTGSPQALRFVFGERSARGKAGASYKRTRGEGGASLFDSLQFLARAAVQTKRRACGRATLLRENGTVTVSRHMPSNGHSHLVLRQFQLPSPRDRAINELGNEAASVYMHQLLYNIGKLFFYTLLLGYGQFERSYSTLPNSFFFYRTP